MQTVDAPAFHAIPTLEAAARAELLSLNNAHAVETSYLEAAGFARMAETAFAAWAAEDASAFLIAFDQDAPYDSPNFLWFRNRYRRFVYVDRIVVAPAARGRGLARGLYAELFARAAADGHDRVTCEVNAVPPNPGSDAFHAALGFAAIETVARAPGKTVRYLSRRL